MFDSRFLGDVHIGRCEIRLSVILDLPESFTSWYELWHRKLSDVNTSPNARRSLKSSNVGGIQLKIDHCFSADKYLFLFMDSYYSMKLFLERKAESSIATSHDADVEGVSPEAAKEAEEHLAEVQMEEDYDMGSPEEAQLKEEKEWNASTERLMEGANFFYKEDLSMDVPDSIPGEGSSTILDKLGDWLLSKETNNVLKSIRKLFHAFGQGLDISHGSMMGGLLQLERFYHNIETRRTGETVRVLGFVEMSRHFWKFSMASYGWRGLNFFGKRNDILKDSVRRDADRKAVLEFLAIPDENLLCFNPVTKGIFQPGHFVAVDDMTQSLVFVIRGTMSTIDTLTDLVCEYSEWNGGLAHGGILSTATWFFRNVYPTLLQHLEDRKLEKLIVCGHSLGGATASMVSMMIHDALKREGKDHIQLHCYSFASPPCVSLNLAKQYENIIDTFVVEDDGVCRLSYGHVMDLRSMIVAALDDHQPESFKLSPSMESLDKVAVENQSGPNGRWLDLSTFLLPQKEAKKRKDMSTLITLHNIKSCRDSLRDPADRILKNMKLYLAGTVYFLHYEEKSKKPFSSMLPKYDEHGISASSSPSENENRSSKGNDGKVLKRVYMEKSDPEFFNEMIIRRTVFLQHIPNVYDKAFERAFETLMIELADEQGLNKSSASAPAGVLSDSNSLLSSSGLGISSKSFR